MYKIEGYYSDKYGWELVSIASDIKEAISLLDAYNKNMSNYKHRIKKENTFYYRVFDKQRDTYFKTGYNSTSKKELIKKFKEYIVSTDNIVSNKEVNTWAKIEDWLQGIELEKSKKPFENIF